MELKHTIALIRELDKEISEVESAIDKITSQMDSPIFTIPGIDHGYYAIKTAHCSFPAGLTSYGEHEPYTRQGLLEFGGCFFVCGSGRQPIQRDKTINNNYYLPACRLDYRSGWQAPCRCGHLPNPAAADIRAVSGGGCDPRTEHRDGLLW
jgi:hypothetical protein